jgi:hypothetical protein
MAERTKNSQLLTWSIWLVQKKLVKLELLEIVSKKVAPLTKV